MEQVFPELPEIPPEDFLAVIHKLLQDDEDAKVWLYVHLCVALARSTLDRDTRLNYLRITSELTISQIHFARELYLRNGIPLKGYLSTDAVQFAGYARELARKRNSSIVEMSCYAEMLPFERVDKRT